LAKSKSLFTFGHNNGLGNIGLEHQDLTPSRSRFGFGEFGVIPITKRLRGTLETFGFDV
jgi:hypothetical protein